MKYFLTVERCSDGQRGIFCDKSGNPFSKDATPHSTEEMHKILDAFWIVLGPLSLPFSEDDVGQHTMFKPLAEYSNEYGIALREIEE